MGLGAGRSCQDHIFSLHTLIHNRRLSGLDTYAVFVDFRKVFDFVNRDLLWKKLNHQFGVNGHFLSLLQALYEQVESCVKVNDEFTDWFELKSGVKQGCILSPILFSMFINDLTVDINSLDKGIDCDGFSIASLLYADDIVVMAENAQTYRKSLYSINSWCLKWGININPSKTKAVHFRTKRRPLTQSSLSLGSQPIAFCHEYRYLGFWFNEFLNMDESSEQVFDRANKALGVVIAKAKSIGGLPFTVFTKLYNTCIIPILGYTAHIWAFKPSSFATKIQNGALRFFFGLGKARQPQLPLY